jgi:hypothetical protein
MKKVLSTSEIVQNLNLRDEPEELCISAKADYDGQSSRLSGVPGANEMICLRVRRT